MEEMDKEAVGNYIKLSKLEDGKEHRYRFVGTSISGFETWTEDSKPVRFEYKPSLEELPSNVRLVDGAPQLKRFLATLVWDYQHECFRLLSFTQTSVKDAIKKLCRDSDYGDPRGYDIKITRTGQNLETEYTVIAAPPKPMAKAIQTALDKFHCDLNGYFAGKDIFAVAE